MERAFYDLKFDLEFQSKTANEFQKFFSSIMASRFPGDFIATRTWGQEGDQKCDGYKLSTGEFFQVYAPDELDAKSAVKKMKEDFAGAHEQWKDKIRKWVFVHNARSGVPPHILQQLTDFKKEFPQTEFGHMGKSELKSECFGISEQAIRNLLGAVPTYQDVNNLSIDAIKKTIIGISKSNGSANPVIEPVSQRKLDANGLSDASKLLFEVGMIKSNLITMFFRNWHEPDLEENTASELHKLYETIKKDCIDSDEIFQRILSNICGADNGNPVATVSALTVMAYFFQTCDIFEQPREEALI